MTSTELLELISIDPNVCHGQPCIKGTRVLVTVILDALAVGLSPSEIVQHYPTLTGQGVRAAAAYGAWLAKQEIPPAARRRVKIKLDENVTHEAIAVLTAAGHDATSVSAMSVSIHLPPTPEWSSCG